MANQIERHAPRSTHIFGMPVIRRIEYARHGHVRFAVLKDGFHPGRPYRLTSCARGEWFLHASEYKNISVAVREACAAFNVPRTHLIVSRVAKATNQPKARQL